jgi:hypothetical protein
MGDRPVAHSGAEEEAQAWVVPGGATGRDASNSEIFHMRLIKRYLDST